MTALVWIQREFRIDYLPALQTALDKHEDVIVAYFHDDKQKIGLASQAWLATALKKLKTDYEDRSGRLWIVEGSFQEKFAQILSSYSISEVYYSFQVGEVFSVQQQHALQICKKLKIGLTPFYSEDFFPADEIKNLKGSPYLVFTPFYKACMKNADRLQPLELTQNSLAKTLLVNCPEDYQKVPKDLQQVIMQPWATKMLKHWQVGEQAAWQRFESFVSDSIKSYDHDRDFPAISATSLLSPYLHFGHINPNSVYFELLAKTESGDINLTQIQPWIRQLFWRGFARYLLVWFPTKERSEFNEKYAKLEWLSNTDDLRAWQTGQTGIPIIDAGMRELWETGTMHNRVRMLVASILTKNLNIDWRQGLEWFEDTLFDADPANNSMGWQWVAGCGVDAAPYYRLFNPVTQSLKFDKKGEYIKRWVPELKSLSAKAVHEPWKHEMECKMKHIELGEDYPRPIVDLQLSRKEHLRRVESLKKTA